MITYYLTKSRNTGRLYYSPVLFEEVKMPDVNGEEKTVLTVKGDTRNLPTEAPRSFLLELGANPDHYHKEIQYDPTTQEFA